MVQSLTVKQQRWVGVACVDWDNPVLVASGFYPADVPEDWYLTYYANYIMACVVSPAKWQGASAAQIADWVEQTQDNFWFYLLCETKEQLELAQLRIQDFTAKFAGIVVSECLSKGLALSSDQLLVVGKEVYVYQHTQLREARASLLLWLASADAQPHALVLLSADCAHEVKNVQTLLTLLGGSH
jgi:hypothetical protein